MPLLQAYNISYQLDNGDFLFQQLSCSMSNKRVGLVGRNGVGKSILASILSGEQQPSSGAVALPQSVAVYHQQPPQSLSCELTIAQFLGKDQVLKAIKQVELGDCSQHWFDIIKEQWDLPLKLTQQLKEQGLPTDLDFPCTQLSGGQFARLKLWQLFASNVELLILDEPSNHLDVQAKHWLIQSIRAFKGAILLVSHERKLLHEMDEIWQLSELGLQVFGGNYTLYAEQKRAELQALERKLASVDKQKKQLQVQIQKNHEKAEQRAAQGSQLRKNGSQPKVLLDAKKDKATAQASNRIKNEQLRRAHLANTERSLKAHKESLKGRKLYLAHTPIRSRKVISMRQGVLPFGRTEPVSFQAYTHDKIYLAGKNGSGKSTLLKTLLGEVSLQQGELQLNTPLYYLDHHFGVIRGGLSLLDNLVTLCHGLKESDARTLLAGVGFSRDNVFRLGHMLSGGEKMKLAMLIVSHQAAHPFLLLDEPDNHLDLESKLMLAQALNQYPGGFILVSHDEDFVRESGVQMQIDI
ncbi:ABC transporter ATP-binding protein [Pseudoalteromonas ruthenica]|uniref:ATP-binding cassette domain-containing protein n=1 Tax=Pseudoalteromonas ruthenica TaxID=151081 RepID=UPI00110835B9|nr:ATP-binding cassette domain-containing protein [Pseudoalteromonas ruthenica]TLX49434.1 ABC transporter ATP-binding protein [Pseudoalteromonas ruthenica]